MESNQKNDGELLEEFVASGNEAPFEILLKRHSNIVFGLSQRITMNQQDAQDAAQAVFLTLARKAETLRNYPSIAGWLYKTTRFVSLRLREADATRDRFEAQAMEIVQDENVPGCGKELREALDAELTLLPEKYRLPIILHHLKEMTEEEIAKLLKLKTSTLSMRLNRARGMLQKRLARRGMAFSVGFLVAGLTQNASANISENFFSSTLEAAANAAAGKIEIGGMVPSKVVKLTQEIIKMLFMEKLKLMTAIVLLTVGFGTGIGIMTSYALEPQPAVPSQTTNSLNIDKTTKSHETPTSKLESAAADFWKAAVTADIPKLVALSGVPFLGLDIEGGFKEEQLKDVVELKKYIERIFPSAKTQSEKEGESDFQVKAVGLHKSDNGSAADVMKQNNEILKNTIAVEVQYRGMQKGVETGDTVIIFVRPEDYKVVGWSK